LEDRLASSDQLGVAQLDGRRGSRNEKHQQDRDPETPEPGRATHRSRLYAPRATALQEKWAEWRERMRADRDFKPRILIDDR
jgi:hypothetical protein